MYDKPWRQGGSAASQIYRPSKNVDKDVYGDDLDKLISTERSVVELVSKLQDSITDSTTDSTSRDDCVSRP